MRIFMTKSFVKILTLAESLSDAPHAGFSKSEVVERAGLPASTVYRLLSDMEKAGYIYKTQTGRLLPNFSFERRIRTGGISPESLRNTCEAISSELQCASEIILHRGHNLLWHITAEHPVQPIRLRAHPGYLRATYELDSISRLALAHCEIGFIESSWELSGFYGVGVQGDRLIWSHARDRILSTDKALMQFDMEGNAKGIRRFAVAIVDAVGELVCIVTVAEAATPLREEQAHIDKIRNILMRAKASLEGRGSDQLDDRGLSEVSAY